MIVCVIAVAAVGVYAFLPSGTASPSSSASDESPYQQLFDQVGPNGEVTKEMALEAFSLAIAPLPGVTIPTGAPPTDAERQDGTFAVEWLLPYMSQLTPEQASVVNAALTPDPAAPMFTPGIAAAMLARPGLAMSVLNSASDDLTKYADDARKAIASNLGRQLGLTWTVSLNSSETADNGKAVYAYTSPALNTPLGYAGCIIHVNPSLLNLNAPEFNNATMAHEMFHCFQHDLISKLGKTWADAPPDWIIEGQAEWVGENIGGPTFDGTATWANYLTSPATPLFTRDYDALGFYQHLAEEGINPWGTFDATITAWENASSPDFANTDAFKAAGAAADTFLDTWASGYFRDSSIGPAWYANGPWTETVQAGVPSVVVGPGDAESRVAAAEANAVWTVNAEADIIDVRGQNHVRMHVGSVPELPVDERWLCVRANNCECPPGQSYSGPDFETTGGDRTIDFGITGGLDGSKVTVIGHSLDEYCKPLPSEGTPAPPCQNNCGHSNGDPHLRTINRYDYDFQAAGEFTLLRNADSSIVIQARQEPYPSLRFPGVSINTAIAALDNGHRVSVYATSSGLDLHVDGQAADPSSPPDLGAGAAVKVVNNGFEIDFPDGSILTTLSVAPWGISAVVNASPVLLSGGMGLLGPITPGNMGVPALPDGSQLPAAPDTETRDKILYGQFADAWRVTDATTLFDYDPGKSTESYTDRNFPSDADRQALEAALASPDPSRQAAAQSACAGLTDADLQTDCEYDVFATGDAGFAQQYGAIQDLYDSGLNPTPPSLPPPSGPTMSGATRVLDVADVAGSAVGPDDTVYLSYDDAAGASHLVAINPQTATVKTTVDTRRSTDIHFVDGSIWASGEHLDANNQDCIVTRYDPATLAEQATFNIPCSQNYPGPQLESTGDAVWFIDTSKLDPSNGTGAQLTRIDPSTNAPDRSVALPSLDGCCQSSTGALFCSCGNDDVWRLTSDGTAFEDLGNYQSYLPAGTGFWTELEDNSGDAAYINGPGGPSATVPLNEGSLVAGDATAAYVQGDSTSGDNEGYPLLRQPTDGSAPVQLATSPVWDAEDILNMTTLDYLSGNPNKFITPDGFVTLWNFQGAEWLQWAPLP